MQGETMKEILQLKEAIGNVKKSSDIFTKIKSIDIDYKQENFIVFYLDSKNKFLDVEVVFKGGLNSCLIDVKTIFRKALSKNANSLIISHNHPSGDLTPSDEDRDVLRKLKEAGEVITIKVLDSIIFNKTEFYSMIF